MFLERQKKKQIKNSKGSLPGTTQLMGKKYRPGTPTKSFISPVLSHLVPYQHWEHPHLSLLGVAVRSDKRDQFLPVLMFAIQGSQRKAGGPQTSHCVIYAALTHTEEGILPPPHQAPPPRLGEGGFLTSQREMTAKGQRKQLSGWGRKHSCFPFANSADWMSLPPLK